MSKVIFEAVVTAGHKEAAVEVPFDPGERWQSSTVAIRPGRRGHAVTATIGRTRFDTHVVARLRRHWLLLSNATLRATGRGVGDSVKVTIAPRAVASSGEARTARPQVADSATIGSPGSSASLAAGAATDPRIDAYIAKAQPFAQPILVHLRAIIHAGCPSVTETIKWGMPAFEYKGPLCGMAAFKAHATFGFWKASLVAEKHPDFAKPLKDSMGQLGRITAVSELPPKKTMIQWIKDAAAINDQGLTVARPKRGPVKQVETPDFLLAAFKKNKAARLGFESLSPSHQREYIEWLTSAKQEATRARRLATALEWMAEGKSQNWRYERKR